MQSRRLRTSVAVLILAATTSCAHGFLPQTGKPKAPPPLPAIEKVLEEALTASSKGWALAALGSGSDSACQQRAGGSPSAILLDLNSDGLLDYGLLVRQADGSTEIIAALRSLDEYRLVSAGKLAADAGATYLVVQKRGAKLPTPIEGYNDFLNHDTIVAQTCGPARTYYVWNGASFMPVQGKQ